MDKKKVIIPIIIILGVIIIDQALKIWVKTHMMMGEDINILGNRILLRFIENPGMAFGMELGGTWGKMALSIFRFLAVGGLIWYLVTIIKKYNSLFFISCIALVIAGAAGNLIDCAFYGMMFGDSFGHVAEIFPAEGGYAPFLYGNVVDMFYCPIINTVLPEGFPIWGGEHVIFFRPIFNVADSAITIAVFLMLICYKKIMHLDENKVEEKKEEE